MTAQKAFLLSLMSRRFSDQNLAAYGWLLASFGHLQYNQYLRKVAEKGRPRPVRVAGTPPGSRVFSSTDNVKRCLVRHWWTAQAFR